MQMLPTVCSLRALSEVLPVADDLWGQPCRFICCHLCRVEASVLAER